MFEAAISEFPFVAELPKREKSALGKAWEHWTQVKAAIEKHGALVPSTLAAKMLNVSRQRIGQLVDSGKLVSVMIEGHPYVTEDSVVELAQSERRAGRPFKVPTTAIEVWQRVTEK